MCDNIPIPYPWSNYAPYYIHVAHIDSGDVIVGGSGGRRGGGELNSWCRLDSSARAWNGLRHMTGKPRCIHLGYRILKLFYTFKLLLLFSNNYFYFKYPPLYSKFQISFFIKKKMISGTCLDFHHNNKRWVCSCLDYNINFIDIKHFVLNIYCNDSVLKINQKAFLQI